MVMQETTLSLRPYAAIARITMPSRSMCTAPVVWCDAAAFARLSDNLRLAVRIA